LSDTVLEQTTAPRSRPQASAGLIATPRACLLVFPAVELTMIKHMSAFKNEKTARQDYPEGGFGVSPDGVTPQPPRTRTRTVAGSTACCADPDVRLSRYSRSSFRGPWPLA
jgi:hypothetical protein